MSRFIEGELSQQAILFPERIDDYLTEENSVPVIEAFVDKLDLFELSFTSARFK